MWTRLAAALARQDLAELVADQEVDDEVDGRVDGQQDVGETVGSQYERIHVEYSVVFDRRRVRVGADEVVEDRRRVGSEASTLTSMSLSWPVMSLRTATISLSTASGNSQTINTLTTATNVIVTLL